MTPILKFKIMVLRSLHNLSDDRTEYLIRDRISFMRFLDLELEEAHERYAVADQEIGRAHV